MLNFVISSKMHFTDKKCTNTSVAEFLNSMLPILVYLIPWIACSQSQLCQHIFLLEMLIQSVMLSQWVTDSLNSKRTDSRLHAFDYCAKHVTIHSPILQKYLIMADERFTIYIVKPETNLFLNILCWNFLQMLSVIN